jgi:hypothetical protein
MELGNPDTGSYHPRGPQAIVWGNNAGNHVIRYNEVYSDDEHRFNDCIGGYSNFSTQGFPGPDSDVYGNIVRDCWDDGIEIEGGGRNVRVWGNYIDRTMVGIATCACTVGPLYVYRNVQGVSQWATYPKGDTDAYVDQAGREDKPRMNRGYFAKVGEPRTGGSGPQYWFHNTLLQPAPPAGRTITLGMKNAILSVGHSGMITELVSLNNIWECCRPQPAQTHVVIRARRRNNPPKMGVQCNTFDYDLYNGPILLVYEGAEAHGIRGEAKYAEGHGPACGAGGRYQLAPDSPGFDAGTRIPNVNDGFRGKAPDMGAHEAGGPPMQFGVDAYLPEEAAEEVLSQGVSTGTKGRGGAGRMGQFKTGSSD